GAEPDVLAEGAAEELLDVADDVVEADDAGLDDLPPAEGEQLVGQGRGAFGGAADLLDVAADLRPAAGLLTGGRIAGGDADLLLDEGGVVEDDGEQVVEVVRHAAGELTEAFQPLRL